MKSVFKVINRLFASIGAIPVLFLLALTANVQAQVATYGFAETNSGYTALSGSAPTVAYAFPWDDHAEGSAHVAPLGFTFSYDGANHTTCFISPNGFITFGVQPSATTYTPLSVATLFTGGGAISALGMDLISDTNPIGYKTIGNAPNRIFVVQWINARRKNMTGTFNFQIRLLETSNRVELSYGACAPDNTLVFNAQVGLRGASNNFLQGDVQNRLQTGTNNNFPWFGKTTNGTANTNTVRTSSTEYPNNGLKYTYTPSLPCTTPSGTPSNFVVGATSTTATSFVGNTFTAAVPAPTNYLVLRSLVNTPPTVLDIPNRQYWAVSNLINGIYTVVSVTNATTFTQTGLQPNTTYYYWVIPYNANCLGAPFYHLNGMIAASKTTCIPAPTGVTATASGNGFDLSWNAVAGATNYTVDVSTVSNFSTFVTGYADFSSNGATTVSISGLSPITTYYYRVRAVGIGCQLYSGVGSVVTLCGSFSIPYFQNFDGTPVNGIPSCMSVANDNSDGAAWATQNTQASSIPNAFHLSTATAVDANDWFFTPGLQLTAGVSYRLRFKYTTQTAGQFSENLRVRLGNGPSAADMNITILNLPNSINTVYQTALVDFTPVINSVYYLGFQGYSFANQSKIIIDDISVIVSPTCFEPPAVTVNSVGVQTATISWEESDPQPSAGYQYYVSTSSNTPVGTVTPTGSVGPGITTATISGLSSATLYYVWVRGYCGTTDQSVWSMVQSFSTDCAPPVALTVVNGTLCGGGSTALTATPPAGATIDWFADAAGQLPVATGATFVTPTLFATTTYYAQSKAPGGIVTVGPSSPIAQGGAQGVSQQAAWVQFTVSSETNLQSFEIYPMVAGQSGQFVIRNAANIVIATLPFVTTVQGGATPQLLTIGVTLTPGNYQLAVTTLPAAGLLVNIENAVYPYQSTVASITGNSLNDTFYLYAYNWKFTNICRSLLTPVTATVTPAPALSLSSSSATVCKGTPTDVVTVNGNASYQSFVWTPATGVSGAAASGYVFQPTETTTYTLVASQTSGGLCASQVTFTVTVKPEPPAITVAPANSTICQGAVVPLSATLATVTPVTIYTENFNATTNNWTTQNNSVGGNTAAAAWTLRTSTYNYASTYWNVGISSNDATRFYFSNSDAQGSPSTNLTRTFLISPSISLVGYTSATLSFWHYLQFIPGNRARVEASIDGGTTWQIVTSYNASVGTPAGFVNSLVNLDAYAGNPNVKVRFQYQASWDYGWAIDNVKITGILGLEVTWMPETDLYFDAAATQPYIAGTPTVFVYAKPSATTVFTGTAQGANGCATSSTATINVIQYPVLGVLSENQSLCENGTPNPLTISGFSGTIVRWEYAADSAFTSGVTPINTTSATLPVNLMGTFTSDRYFRVVLQNGTCPPVYTNPVVIGYQDSTWNGTTWVPVPPVMGRRAVFNFSGNYVINSNMEACSVQVLSGNVTVASGSTLTVQSAVVVNPSATLTLANHSSLIQLTDVANTGVITYQRLSQPMLKNDYTYWSSPVTGQDIRPFSPLTALIRYYTYNAVTDAWNSLFTATQVNPSHLMVPARGYIIRTPENYSLTVPTVFNGLFTGVPNNGPYTAPIDATGVSNWNLLGNPYPSALDLHAFLLHPSNAVTLDGTVYLWTHNTLYTNGQYTINDYATYNFTGATQTGIGTAAPGTTTAPTRYLAAGQGFFIGGLQSGTAQFTNAMRVAGNNQQFFKTTEAFSSADAIEDLERHRIWLHISGNSSQFKQTLIGYVEGATDGLDRGFDGTTAEAGNGVNIYTMVQSTKLGTQGMALPFEETDVIPIGYRCTAAGTYTIALSNFDGLFTNQAIYLEDVVLGVIHDLKVAPYTFASTAGTHDTRFVLRFTNQTLSVTDGTTPKNAVWAYVENGVIQVHSSEHNLQSVEIHDLRGRLLATKKGLQTTTTAFTSLSASTQVLLVRITTADGIVTTQRVVY